MDIALQLGGLPPSSDRECGAADPSLRALAAVRERVARTGVVEPAENALAEYFRCPSSLAPVDAPPGLDGSHGYFTFFGDICYGRCDGVLPAASACDPLPEISQAVVSADRVRLPFELSEVLRNLREERYPQGHDLFGRFASSRAVRNAYYLLRPLLTVPVRKHLQRLRLSDRERIAFPRWPVDTSVEGLMQSAMGLALRRAEGQRIPFVWFWPDGANGCAVVTHDVESHAGQRLCSGLMDLDESYGIVSSFQLMPEPRDSHFNELADAIRRRGFELNLHDLNHDGHLFRDLGEFRRRAVRINEHARELGCRGFRSGAMYREQAWYGAFEFSYDMSVPNVAHLEPQRGGCCTVMPYFVGNVLELPLTTTQDYSLFHILGDYSTRLWEQQIETILAHNGLVSFIAHPDYLSGRRERTVYEALLARLAKIREERHVWMPLPGEVDVWWRNRRQMTLMPEGGSWRIEGPDSGRARLAYASLDNGRVVYEVVDPAQSK